MIPIDLVVEDAVSEAVARKVIARSARQYLVGSTYGRVGFGYLKSRLDGFNRAARSTPYLFLTDLDQAECPPGLLAEWFGATERHPNLLFQVAVREVEAWLLAHREAFAAFTGVRASLVPQNVEEIGDAKKCLIDLVLRSKKRALREDIAPPPGGNRTQGPDYNGRLTAYVFDHWDPHVAQRHSISLARMVATLDNFSPSWAAHHRRD